MENEEQKDEEMRREWGRGMGSCREDCGVSPGAGDVRTVPGQPIILSIGGSSWARMEASTL